MRLGAGQGAARADTPGSEASPSPPRRQPAAHPGCCVHPAAPLPRGLLPRCLPAGRLRGRLLLLGRAAGPAPEEEVRLAGEALNAGLRAVQMPDPQHICPGLGLQPRPTPSSQGRLLSGASPWGWPVPTSPSPSGKGPCPLPHCCLALGPGRGSSRSRVHFTLEGRSGRVRTGMRPREGSSVPPGRLGPVLRRAPCPRAAHGLTEGGPLLPPKRSVECEGRRGRGR